MSSGHEARRLAVVAGASGLVGSQLLRLLLRGEEYSRVVALVRRPLGLVDPRLHERAARFDALENELIELTAASDAHRLSGESVPIDVFCCLGTTLKTAGSRPAFARVDRDYVLALGRWAVRANARRMVVVSATGADSGSRLFYNRIKGEMEAGLRALALRSLVLLRPGLLDGARGQFRPAEALALAVLRPLGPLLPQRLRPVRVEDVAACMLSAAMVRLPPQVIESVDIHGAAASLTGDAH